MVCHHPDIAWFKNILANQELVARLQAIKLIVADVDGTLTDGSIYFDAQGEGGRAFSVQDGYIVRPAMQAGLTIALMSGKNNNTTLHRGTQLGIPEDLCFAGILTKPEAVSTIQQKHGIEPAQTLMVGDDHLDAQVKLHGMASLFVCPANTPFYYQTIADIILPRAGHEHAVRLLFDLILYVRKQHFSQDLIDKALCPTAPSC